MRRYVSLLLSFVLVAAVSCVDEDNVIVVSNGQNVADTVPNGNDTISGGDATVPGFDQEGASLALFSISATKRVHFSRGNLQYRASTATWRFAEHQYDCIGYGNENISASYDGWIDLFEWGTSGWESGAVAYQPWSTSTNDADYYPGGSATSNLAGDYANADWGRYNRISNGGNKKNVWRTLKAYEWRYLLFTRDDAGQKTGYATIGNIMGLVILPDEWVNPSELPEFVSLKRTWSDNCYNLSQWDAMQEAGAVFLPATGYRSGTEVMQAEDIGSYWTATHYDEAQARIMTFSKSVLYTYDVFSMRSAGLAVRAVKNE